MFIVAAVISALLAFAVIASALGKLTKHPKIVGNLAALGVPADWLPRLAIAEIAGGIGLLVGLAVPAIGVAAAIGLIIYFVGAVITHVRARDKEIAGAAILGAIAVAALVLRLFTM
jgi:uncharacterized membrane protein YphA (DoxX/SURF4 family)